MQTKTEKALWWTSLKTYEDCPQQFLFKYGRAGIDLGGGPGEPKPIPVRKSQHHTMMGTVIQAVVETFYKETLWLDQSTGKLVDTNTLWNTLRSITNNVFQKELVKSYIDWDSSPSRADLLQVCHNGVFGYLKAVKDHLLIGDQNFAEKVIISYVGEAPVGAKPDVVVIRNKTPGRSNPGITIVDGKNSASRDKYSDPDQLRFYALVYYQRYGHLPDRIGFIYYRYLSGATREDGTPDSGVDWIPFDMDDLKGISKRVVDARAGILGGSFEATPNPPICKFCDWETVCPQRQAQRSANAEKRNKGKKLDVPEGTPTLDGFFEIG